MSDPNSPSPVAGVLREILAEEGSTVDVDSAIAIVGMPAE